MKVTDESTIILNKENDAPKTQSQGTQKKDAPGIAWKSVLVGGIPGLLLGTAGTVLAGGILWGVWHAPLTAAGHNFGLDYAGYPYTGILAMAVICTVNGAILMWLTKRTDSVYPAAIYHACNNNGSQLIGLILLLNGIPEITAAPPFHCFFLLSAFYGAAGHTGNDLFLEQNIPEN